MRKRDFDYSNSFLKKKYPKELELWQKTEKWLREQWSNFVKNNEYFYRYWIDIEREKEFHLLFYKFKSKEEEYWKEGRVFNKASFANDFCLLNESICEITKRISEKEKVKGIHENKEIWLDIEFDTDPKNEPDILINSKKDANDKIGIEIVEVHACSLEIGENEQSFTKFIKNRLDKKIRESVKKYGKTEIELIKKSIKIEGVNFEKEENGFIVSWGLPKRINNLNYLIENLKKTIKRKNEAWEKKDFKHLKTTGIWTVLSSTFAIEISHKINKDILSQEIKKDYFYLFLLEKVHKELSNVVIRFSYLIITFLSCYYLDEESILDRHDPFIKVKREEATTELITELKEKGIYKLSKNKFIKHSPLNVFLEMAIPNLYMPVINNKRD